MQMLTALRNALDEKIGQSTVEATSSCELEFEEAIDLLSAARRRHVINHLHTVEGEVSLRELSEHITDIEDADRKNVHIALYQQHLTKMAESDIILYDKRQGMIAPGPNCDLLYEISSEIEQKLN